MQLFTRKLLSVREAAAYLGVSKSWLDKQRLAGGLYLLRKLGRRGSAMTLPTLMPRFRRLSAAARPRTKPKRNDSQRYLL